MRTFFAITVVLTAGPLIALPTLATQRQLERLSTFYEQQGGGAQLPEELRPWTHSNYDWAEPAAGSLFSLMGTLAGRRT